MPVQYLTFLVPDKCTPLVMLSCLDTGMCVYTAVMGDGRESLGCVTRGQTGLPESRSNSRAPDPARATSSVVRASDQGHMATPEVLSTR